MRIDCGLDVRRSSSSRARIWYCTVASSAVVGSSAMIERGARAPGPRRSRLAAAAAAQLERIAVRNALRIGNVDRLQGLDHLRGDLAFRSLPRSQPSPI